MPNQPSEKKEGWGARSEMSTRAIIGGTIIHLLKYECFSGRFIQVKQARDSWPEEMCLEGPSGALTLEWW